MKEIREPKLFTKYGTKIMALLFLTIIPNNAWSAQEGLQESQEAIFQIYSPLQRSTGFVIEGNILVTNFHVLITLLKTHIDSTIIRNKKGQFYYIEHIIGADLITDLALLKIKNYNGPKLALSHLRSDQEDFLLMVFLDRELTPVNLNKFMDIGEANAHFSNPLRMHLYGASGSPIVNNHGDVIAVVTGGSQSIISATKVETLQELLDRTRHQQIIGYDIFEWLKKKISNLISLAIQGYAPAQFSLARMLLPDGLLYSQTETVGSFGSSVTWMRRAAEQEHIEAQYILAVMFYRGRGVEQNFEKAAAWMRKAAEKGCVKAQYMLAVMFYEGSGVEQNFEKAAAWMRKAAEKGYVEAQYMLAMMFYEGSGVEQNLKEAVTWIRKAAEQGHVRSQQILPSLTYFSRKAG